MLSFTSEVPAPSGLCRPATKICCPARQPVQSDSGARIMDDFGDPELEALLHRLKSGVERRKSLIASNEDIAGTHESLDGAWGEWMCLECGIFMKEHQHRCVRCSCSRF